MLVFNIFLCWTYISLEHGPWGSVKPWVAQPQEPVTSKAPQLSPLLVEKQQWLPARAPQNLMRVLWDLVKARWNPLLLLPFHRWCQAREVRETSAAEQHCRVLPVVAKQDRLPLLWSNLQSDAEICFPFGATVHLPGSREEGSWNSCESQLSFYLSGNPKRNCPYFWQTQIYFSTLLSFLINCQCDYHCIL